MKTREFIELLSQYPADSEVVWLGVNKEGEYDIPVTPKDISFESHENKIILNA